MSGSYVPIVWRGRRTTAFVPNRLIDRNLSVDATTVARTARAEAELERSAEAMPEDFASLARLLLHAEGVASSFVEGVTAPVVEIVLAEQDTTGSTGAAAWVAANLAAVTEAISSARDGPMTLDLLCGWHRTLMTGSPTPARYVGVVRDEQGWIGGTSPFDAHLVTPPPDNLPALLEDLISFVNRADVDPVTQAAVAHAQLELIHPFADGNGRIGRILIAWMLTRRMGLITPPPVSTRIAAAVGGYTAGLVQFRVGHIDPWVRWFAEAVTGAGRAQRDLITAVANLRSLWEQQLGAVQPGGRRLRRDANAWRLLDLLPRHLVVTSAVAAADLGISLKAALDALDDLERAGILVRYKPRSATGLGRPEHRYVSEALLGLVGSTTH